MVARNVRNKANSYVYKEKRKIELRKVKEYINAIQSDRYHIKLIKHENIIKSLASKEQDDIDLINQLFNVTQLLPNNILTLPKSLKCQSRYIGYRAIISLQDCGNNKLLNDYLDIKSKHLKSYIKSYVNGTILVLLKEKEREISVKLHLVEPNEEEAKVRENLRLQNEINKERNKEILEKITYNKLDEDDFYNEKVSTKIIQKVTRRKVAKVEDKNRLLMKSKQRIKLIKDYWDETKDEVFSCSFTVLHAEVIKGSVVDKPVYNKNMIYEQKGPKVVSLEKVREWLRYLENTEDSLNDMI